MAILPKYEVRELCRLSNHELWTIPDGLIELRYDDGVVITTNRRMQYTVVILRHFYNRWPGVKAKTTHDLGRRRIKKMTHGEVIAPVLWDVFDEYGQQGQYVNPETLAYSAYDATNDIYNTMSYQLEEYVQSLSILDFVDVVNHEIIKEAQARVLPNAASIDRLYNTILKVLRDPKELVGNRLADAVRNELVDSNQVLQSVGPRGATTDIDSYIFRTPIMVGFAHGFKSFYDSLIDSRLAAKAQSFTGPPLQTTEYFNRQLQLMAHALMRLYREVDCGSDQYITWRVRAKDLPYLDGKYMLMPDGKLRMVRSTDRHLVDQVIQFRSVLYCRHNDSQGKCKVCYGGLADSIPMFTNIGHVAATNLGEKISQNVLAIKHVERSSSVDGVELNDYEQRYLKIGGNPNHLMLADRVANADRIELVIQAKQAPHISDVDIVDDVDNLLPGFISELTEVLFKVTRKDKTDSAMVSVYSDNRPASLSKPVLHRLKEKGWEINEDSTYTIDLTGWDMDEPVFELPLRHINMLDYAMSIKDFICAAKRKGQGKTLRDCTTAEQALKEFYQLVSKRLKTNIVHLEILIAATMVRSRTHRDYRLPLYGNAVEFGEFTTTMYLRSMAPAMAYQGQKQVLDRPMLYLVRNRPAHTLDALLVPINPVPVKTDLVKKY